MPDASPVRDCSGQTHPAGLTPEQDTVNATTLTRSLHRCAITISLPLLAILAGCATLAPTGTVIDPVTGMPRSSPDAPTVSPLVTEQRWLEEWFRGTPVVIAMNDSGTLAVDVPLAHSFDGGSSKVKPALGAVLDRVATSLRRQPSMLVTIAAPADARGSARLAAGRAQKVREHLVSRGVAATRLTGGGAAAAGSAVQMRIVLTPQPTSALDDAWRPLQPLAVSAPAAPPGDDQAAASNAPNSGS